MNKELLSQFDSFCNDKKISNAAVARSIGVSGAAISLWKKGEYRGDVLNLEKKINDFIEAQKIRSAKPKENERFHITSDVKSINFVISEAVTDNEMGLIYGEPGTGKTYALKEYVKNNPQAMLIEADICITARSLLNELCDRLGLTTNRELHNKIVAISDYLKKAQKILIIDEAEHLPLKALEALRRIHDFSSTPIIFVGTKILLKNLTGKNGELAQLYSRIGVQWIMQGLSESDYRDVFGDSSEVIARYTKGIFRQASKLAKRAKRLARANYTEVNSQIVEEASKMLVLI